MSKRKRRLKKKVKVVLFLSVIILFLIIFGNYKKEDKLNIIKENKEEIINSIVIKINDEEIDNSFITWIDNNYKNSLNKINNYLIDKEYNKAMWHEVTDNSLIVLKDLYNDNYKDKENVRIINGSKEEISLSFIGDVSLADNWYIMPEYDKRSKKVYGILSESVVNIMTSSDLMIANSEFTVSDRGSKMPGKYYTFKASPKRLSIYEEMGVDLVTLANNHVYDFGKEAFYDMLEAFKEYDIPYVGAGKDIEEAKRPYYFIINGYKIAFVNATRAEKIILTPEATETEGGVLRCYDPTMFSNVIKEAKANSDYVVALVHFGKEDSHSLEQVQIDTSKLYIDSGADIIIGTHAHVLQGIEFYKDKPIIYNLGDFIFNNETKDTGIFQIKMSFNKELEYYFIPCLEKDEYTKTLEGAEKQRVINNMISWSINANIDENGKITKR